MLSKSQAWKKIKEICEEKNIANKKQWIGSTTEELNKYIEEISAEVKIEICTRPENTLEGIYATVPKMYKNGIRYQIASEEYSHTKKREFIRHSDIEEVKKMILTYKNSSYFHEVLQNDCRLFLDLEKKGKNTATILNEIIEELKYFLPEYIKKILKPMKIAITAVEINVIYCNRKDKASAHIIIKMLTAEGEISFGRANKQYRFWKEYIDVHRKQFGNLNLGQFFDYSVYRNYGQMRLIYSKKRHPESPPFLPEGPVNELSDFFISHPKDFYCKILEEYTKIENPIIENEVISIPVPLEIVKKYLKIAEESEKNPFEPDEEKKKSFTSDKEQVLCKIKLVAYEIFSLIENNDTAYKICKKFIKKLTESYVAYKTAKEVISEIYEENPPRCGNISELLHLLDLREDLINKPIKKIFFNAKYINYDMFDAKPGQPIIIKSPTGTGKTFGFYKKYADKNTISIDYRRTIGRDKQAKYNVELYDEYPINAQHFSVTVESLHKYENEIKRADVIFDDECEHGKYQISNCKYPEKTINAYKYLFENKKVFLCSANADNLTVEFCRDLGYEPIFYENTYTPPKKTYAILEENKLIIAAENYIKNEKKKLVIFCSEKKKANVLFYYFKSFFEEDEILLMTSEQKNQNKIIMENVEDHWSNKKCIIMTSCVEAGVSYDLPDVERIFGFFTNNSINHISAFQMLKRCRKIKEVLISVKNVNFGKLTEAEVWGGIGWKDKISRYKFITEKLQTKYSNKYINELIYSDVNKILVRNILFDHNSRSNMRDLLVKELEGDNFILAEANVKKRDVDLSYARDNFLKDYIDNVNNSDDYYYERLKIHRFKELGYKYSEDILKSYGDTNKLISAYETKEKIFLTEEYKDQIEKKMDENGKLPEDFFVEETEIPFLKKKYKYVYDITEDEIPDENTKKIIVEDEKDYNYIDRAKDIIDLSDLHIILSNFKKEFTGSYNKITFSILLTNFILKYLPLLNISKAANRKKTEKQIKYMNNRSRICYISPILKLGGMKIQTKKISKYESEYSLSWLF